MESHARPPGCYAATAGTTTHHHHQAHEVEGGEVATKKKQTEREKEKKRRLQDLVLFVATALCFYHICQKTCETERASERERENWDSNPIRNLLVLLAE